MRTSAVLLGLLVTYVTWSAYATRYRALVDEVRAAEARLWPGQDEIAKAVAQSFYKVMAYKDEYEVARLHAAPELHHHVPVSTQIGAGTPGQQITAHELRP